MSVLISTDNKMPLYASIGAAGCDLYSTKSGVIAPGQRVPIPTGYKMAIPDSLYCKIECRSSLAYHYGISVLAGVIDSDYRGEIFVILLNNGDEPFTYNIGDRIAQGIFLPKTQVQFIKVDQLPDTIRGDGAIGSTGK